MLLLGSQLLIWRAESGAYRAGRLTGTVAMVVASFAVGGGAAAPLWLSRLIITVDVLGAAEGGYNIYQGQGGFFDYLSLTPLAGFAAGALRAAAKAGGQAGDVAGAARFGKQATSWRETPTFRSRAATNLTSDPGRFNHSMVSSPSLDTIPEGRRLITYMPPNRGFVRDPVKETLSPGSQFDRYGFEGGTFASPVGTPAPMRALLPGSLSKPYTVYEVLKPLDVKSGTTAPWFQQPGLGIQFELPKSILSLVKLGFLRRVS